MFEKPPQYHTFVLRIWQERDGAGETAVWRYSLHNVEESERIGFNSLEDLTHHLQSLLNLPISSNERD